MSFGPKFLRERKPLYQALAQHIAWQPPAGSEYVGQRAEEIRRLIEMLPSGSGWDLATKLDEDKSSPERIVLFGEFHHMAESGCYDGWTSHEIIVTPSLRNGFNLRVTGQNRNDIKDYLHEMFDFALREPVRGWAAEEEEEARLSALAKTYTEEEPKA